jgi:hypothetical protein
MAFYFLLAMWEKILLALSLINTLKLRTAPKDNDTQSLWKDSELEKEPDDENQAIMQVVDAWTIGCWVEFLTGQPCLICHVLGKACRCTDFTPTIAGIITVGELYNTLTYLDLLKGFPKSKKAFPRKGILIKSGSSNK